MDPDTLLDTPALAYRVHVKMAACAELLRSPYPIAHLRRYRTQPLPPYLEEPMLSDRERRVLAELEQQFHRDDPRPDSHVRGTGITSGRRLPLLSTTAVLAMLSLMAVLFGAPVASAAFAAATIVLIYVDDHGEERS